MSSRHRFAARSSVAFAAAATFAAFAAPAIAQSTGSQSPPPAVVVAPVQTQEISRSAQFVGRVQAIQQVDAKARVEGFIQEVAFQEGSMVNKGDLLYQIETAPYDAAVASAQAAVASGKAALLNAQAAFQQADVNLSRQQTLFKAQDVSQATLDQAQADRDQANAQVEAANAQIAEANAQLQTAELNLFYTKITSPIDGRVGKTSFTQGNLVDAQSGTLATVVQMDPIRAVFSIAERDYVQLAEQLSAQPDLNIQQEFVPLLVLPNGQTYQEKGKISFADNQVDQQTGTIAVYADFANPKAVLIPGQFVTVTVEIGQPQSLPVVPAGSVLQDKDGPYVLVVDKDNRAEIRRIETADKTATGWAVSKGLTQGETIIVDGIQKVQPGMVVNPQTATAAG